MVDVTIQYRILDILLRSFESFLTIRISNILNQKVPIDVQSKHLRYLRSCFANLQAHDHERNGRIKDTFR